MLLEQSNIPEIKDAVIRVRELSADEKARQIAFEREMNIFERKYFFSSFERMKEERDQLAKIVEEKNQQLEDAEKHSKSRGIAEGIKTTALNMLKLNLSTETISQCTGLSVDEIDELRNSLY